MAKLKKNNFFSFRFGTIGFMVSVCAVLGISIGVSNAQIWSEPSTSPPSGNVASPIWNQNAADQTANFRINGTGTFGNRVGIGTSSATSRFHVALTKTNTGTTIDEVGDYTDYVTIGASASTSNGDRIPLVFNLGGPVGPHISSAIEAGREASGWNTYLAFYTNNLTSGAQGIDAIQEKMRLTSAGYLGIGTSTPAAPLSFGGGFNIPKTYIYDDNSYVTGFGAYSPDTLRIFGDSMNRKITLGSQTRAGVFTETMRVDGDNVGIGTTAPYAKLSVTGNVGQYSAYGSSVGLPVASSLYLGDGNFNNASYYNSAPGLSAVFNPGMGVAGDLAFYYYNGGAGARAEAMRISGGNVGIGATVPAYKLDVNGTVNANGGAGTALLATSTGAYGVYATGVTAGVAGISTAGYGVYGSSSSSYAGYFNGNINVTGNTSIGGTLNSVGAITQNGVAVCLSNGTNCPSSGTKMVIRYTRATVLYNSSLATKDALCVSEFGSDYITASLEEIGFAHGTAKINGSWSDSAYDGGLTSTSNVRASQTSNITPSFTVAAIAWRERSETTGSYSVYCVNKYANFRRTRGTVAYNATLATKDALCVSEIGANYLTASLEDVSMVAKGAKLERISWNGVFPGALGTLTSNQLEQQATYPAASSGTSAPTNGWQHRSLSSGTYNVYCIGS